MRLGYLALAMAMAIGLTWAAPVLAQEPGAAPPGVADEATADEATADEMTEDDTDRVERDPSRSRIHNSRLYAGVEDDSEQETIRPEYLKLQASAQRQTGLLIGGLGSVLGLGSVATGAVLLSNSPDDDNTIGAATLAGGAVTVASSILIGLLISAVAED